MFKIKPQITPSQKIEIKSESAISVFKTTLSSLLEIDDDVQVEIKAKEDAISDINSEINSLKERKVKNDKFINKLKEFFE